MLFQNLQKKNYSFNMNYFLSNDDLIIKIKFCKILYLYFIVTTLVSFLFKKFVFAVILISFSYLVFLQKILCLIRRIYSFIRNFFVILMYYFKKLSVNQEK